MAVSRLDVPVLMIGRVGDDLFGKRLMKVRFLRQRTASFSVLPDGDLLLLLLSASALGRVCVWGGGGVR